MVSAVDKSLDFALEKHSPESVHELYDWVRMRVVAVVEVLRSECSFGSHKTRMN